MLISITGYKKSGKDLISDYIIQNYPQYEFTKYSFAQPLKQGVQAFFGWSPEHLSNQVLKETVDPDYGISPRSVLQYLGTNIMRENLGKKYPEFKKVCQSSFWVKRFIKTYNQNPKNYILPDTRFQEELDAIKSLGGITIRVNRNSTRPTLENLGKIGWKHVWKAFKTYRSQTLKFLLGYLSPAWVPWYNAVKGMLLIEHPSENIEHLPVDYVVENNGSLEDLYQRVDEILKQYEPVKK